MTPLPTARRRARVAAALAGAALTLAACGDPTGPLPREGAPDALEFLIGGFASDTRIVRLRGDTVLLWRTPWSESRAAVDTVRAVPTPEAWRAFWAAAERAGVRRWRRRYVAEGVLDGTGWSLRIVAGDRIFESGGGNAYPDRLGGEHELQMTSAFRAFLAALGDLVGRPV